MTTPPAAILDEQLTAFLQGRISIVVGAVNTELEPSIARAVGCRVAADGTRVSVFLPASQAGRLLADIRANGRIAVVFTQPSTHRTVQLKGRDAQVEPLEESDGYRLAAYRDGLARELGSIGFQESFVRGLLTCSSAEVVAVGFTPIEAFNQTPGPGAGAVLRGTS